MLFVVCRLSHEAYQVIIRKRGEVLQRKMKVKREKSGKQKKKDRNLECLECDLLLEFFTLFNNFV